MVVSRGHATLAELQTIYGAEDAYDLFEIIRVDNHNEHLLTKSEND